MPGADIIRVAYRGKQNLYAENNGWTDIYFFELSEMKRALTDDQYLRDRLREVRTLHRDPEQRPGAPGENSEAAGRTE